MPIGLKLQRYSGNAENDSLALVATDENGRPLPAGFLLLFKPNGHIGRFPALGVEAIPKNAQGRILFRE